MAPAPALRAGREGCYRRTMAAIPGRRRPAWVFGRRGTVPGDIAHDERDATRASRGNIGRRRPDAAMSAIAGQMGAIFCRLSLPRRAWLDQRRRWPKSAYAWAIVPARPRRA